jgi:hypothetical protein
LKKEWDSAHQKSKDENDTGIDKRKFKYSTRDGLRLVDSIAKEILSASTGGIRPLIFGTRKSSLAAPVSAVPATPAKMNNAKGRLNYALSSKSVAIDTLGFNLVRDLHLRVRVLRPSRLHHGRRLCLCVPPQDGREARS